MANKTPSIPELPPGGFGRFITSPTKTAGANKTVGQPPTEVPSILPGVQLANQANQQSIKPSYVPGKDFLDLVKSSEGFSEKAYVDKNAKGRPITIGWGFTRKSDGTKYKLGDRMTMAEADAYLVSRTASDVAEGLSSIPQFNSMTQTQKDALASFAHNVGSNFYGSEGYEEITNALKYGEWDKVPGAMKLYNKGGGVVLPGLIDRRKAEGDLWSKVTEESKNQTLEANKPFDTRPAEPLFKGKKVKLK